jgi:3-oxoacyl-[acyl-carrier protein] reductase
MTQNGKRIVVVTGGSRGLGRVVCQSFAGPDSHIYFNYHASEAGAQETGKLIDAAGGSWDAARVDITSLNDVSAWFKRIATISQKIDVLVNNAGITRDGLIAMMKESDWDDVLETNLKGTFNCIKPAIRLMMRKRYGRIVNVTSVVGAMGNPGQANYAASKAGIIGLTKSVAKEIATRGITVNAVAPGYLETDMTASLQDKAKKAMLSFIPMGRAGTLSEVAAAIKFLASDEAAYITGQVLHVSGGMYT